MFIGFHSSVGQIAAPVRRRRKFVSCWKLSRNISPSLSVQDNMEGKKQIVNANDPDVPMLMAMLKHIGYVARSRDRVIYASDIIKCLLDGTANVVRNEWGDAFRRDNSAPPDLMDQKMWGIREIEHLNITFSVNGEYLECTVLMYDGTAPNYFQVKFKAVLSFDPQCIKMLGRYIAEDFESSIKRARKAYRKEQDRQWMEKEGRRLLGDERYTRTEL